MANPKQEAYEKLAGEFEVRVLEPSPPAVSEPPFTDDPIQDGEVYDGRLLVSPIPNGDLTWDELAAQRPEIADWCAERWLGAYRRLDPLPASFAVTRRLLHEVADAVVAPARKPENEISLRYTRGGFGTPFFEEDGDDCQVRVEDGRLIRQRDTEETAEPLPAEVSEDSARALGDFYGFACSVLEELRHEQPDEDPSLVRLWPEGLRHRDRAGFRGQGRARQLRGLAGRRLTRRALSLRRALDRRGLRRALERHQLPGRRAHLCRAARGSATSASPRSSSCASAFALSPASARPVPLPSQPEASRLSRRPDSNRGPLHYE